MTRGMNPTSRHIDYEKLKEEVARRARSQKDHSNMIDLCARHGFTYQRICIMKKNPTCGALFLNKMKRAGINIDYFIINE